MLSELISKSSRTFVVLLTVFRLIFSKNPYLIPSFERSLMLGRDRIHKYMEIMGIEAIYLHKKKAVSVKDNQHKIHSYLLDQYWIKSGKTKTIYIPNVNEV